MQHIRAITLDLDDTLWPVAPAIVAADQALLEWLAANCPEASRDWPLSRLHQLRDEVWHSNPALAHDFTAQRMLTIAQVLEPYGLGAEAVDQAFDAFYAARNRVQLYPDALAALELLAERFPLVALSNGNACLQRIGLDHLFHGAVHAREVGFAKPAPEIFHLACARAGIAPDQVLHVGDHPEQDVLGARAAGLHAVWIDRGMHAWPEHAPKGDRCVDLTQLCEYLTGQRLAREN